MEVNTFCITQKLQPDTWKKRFWNSLCSKFLWFSRFFDKNCPAKSRNTHCYFILRSNKRLWCHSRKKSFKTLHPGSESASYLCSVKRTGTHPVHADPNAWNRELKKEGANDVEEEHIGKILREELPVKAQELLHATEIQAFGKKNHRNFQGMLPHEIVSCHYCWLDVSELLFCCWLCNSFFNASGVM